MSKRLSHAVMIIVSALAALVVMPAAAFAQFEIGLEDPGFSDPAGTTASQVAFGALNAIHGSTVRLDVTWGTIAPDGTTAPAGFNPSNPGDPQYNWTSLDAAVRTLTEQHDQVLIDLTGPSPGWATPAGRPSSFNSFGGAWEPNATQFGLFAHAAALRYSGTFADPLHPGSALPRVSEWEIWNEENLPEDLTSTNPVSEYRALLNDAYAGIKQVNPSDTVSIGGLAPVSFVKGFSISPLTFAAQLLCLRRVGTHFVRDRACPVKAHFDALGIHPYSLLATPTKHAYYYDDILVGDMQKLSTLLDTARRLKTAASGSHFGLWVTEWSWFTNPPDPQIGDPPAVAARYTAYSMYEMWKAGTTLVIWFLAQDPKNIGPNSPSLVYGGGLYNASGKPKPMMTAFAFPFVASVRGDRGFAWGRAPVSKRTRVIVEEASGRRWKRIGMAQTSKDGVFQLHFSAKGHGTFRARISGGAVSLGYNSVPIPAVRTH